MKPNLLLVSAALLVGLTFIPTLIHGYIDMKTADGYRAAAVGGRLAGLPSRPGDKRAGWAKKVFDSDDWSDRGYMKPEGGEVRLFISRSFDLKRLYHHPELAVAYGHDLRDTGIEALTDRPGVPVHVLRAGGDHAAGLALYTLLYDGTYVGDPYPFQVRLAARLLLAPRRAMTLFFAHDLSVPPGASLDGTAVARVLAAAIRSFESQRPSGLRE